MKIFHLVKIYFDRRRPDITQEWLDKRYEFFKDHTLEALRNQTFKDFKIWFCCAAGMENSVEGLRRVAPKDAIFTFGGDPQLPNIDDLPEETASELKASDYVYTTRIDSDDVYCNRALALCNQARPKTQGKTEAAFFRRGYMHDINTGRLGVYDNPSSPFHTLMIPTKTFLNPAAYKALDYGDHSKVRSSYPHQYLEDWKFAVLLHGGNFLTTFDYSAVPDAAVPKLWTPRSFYAQPVVFDVDDFCDKWNCLPALDKLAEKYIYFKCTLFTIPTKISPELLAEAKRRNWIEIAPHGITHEPNEEMNHVSREKLAGFLKGLDYKTYAKVFRPPGWALPVHNLAACNDAGLAVAIHVRDRQKLAPLAQHGYYCCDDRYPYWHGHTHDVCGNWIDAHLDDLLKKWPARQPFQFVSEAVVVPQNQYVPSPRGDHG